MTKQYIDLGRRILSEGVACENRTGVDTIKLFGESLKFDLSEGFPLLTTKKINPVKPILEFLWFLRGPEDGKNMNVKFLHDNDTHFWDTWADEDGSVGPCYGSVMRGLFKDEQGENIDQIALLMEGLKNNPMSRRHIVSLWHPAYLPNEKNKPKENPKLGKGSLAACFWNYTVDIEPFEETFKVNLQVSARSSDFGVGLPFNICQFAAFCEMLAQQLGYKVGSLYIPITNSHIYVDQIDGLMLQFERTPRTLPTLRIKRKPESIFDYIVDDFEVSGYDPHPFIKLPVAE